MEQNLHNDELLAAQSEIRHLKNTLVALRSRLESMKFEGQENVQRAIVERQDEIAQLRDTAGALRDELDNDKEMPRLQDTDRGFHSKTQLCT